MPLARLADFRVGLYHVYRRPFLDEFLVVVADWFDLAVWSSATSTYVHDIVEHVFGASNTLHFVWPPGPLHPPFRPGVARALLREESVEASEAGIRTRQMLMVDDSPEKLAQHYGNHIRVSPFTGDESDTELRALLPFLGSLRTANDVRRIEKRSWRQHRLAEQP